MAPKRDREEVPAVCAADRLQRYVPHADLWTKSIKALPLLCAREALDAKRLKYRKKGAKTGEVEVVNDVMKTRSSGTHCTDTLNLATRGPGGAEVTK
jgi:hypothetical protein